MSIATSPGAAATCGVEYTLVWHDVSPDKVDVSPRRSGIETRLVEAVTGSGERIAYLRISHVDAELLARTVPTPAHHMDENRGWCLGLEGRNYHEIDTDELVHIWCRAHLYAHVTYNGTPGRSLTAQHAPGRDEMCAGLDKLFSAYEERYRRWCAFNAVPMVAYSHVEHDEHRPYRRRGIGTAMYCFAGQKLAAEGRVLRASGLQSDSAEHLWDALWKNPQIPTRTIDLVDESGETLTYRCIDYT